ncbi:MAG: ATP-binding protein [Phycisphaerae bacterium]
MIAIGIGGGRDKVSDTLREIVIANTLADAKRPEQEILREVEAAGYHEEDIFAIKLALEEAMTNAVRHGNRNDPTKRVRVKYKVTPAETTIIVCDEGRGFQPDDVPDPTLPENIERPCGRGLMLMRAYMTRVEYNRSGNEVHMVKVNER